MSDSSSLPTCTALLLHLLLCVHVLDDASLYLIGSMMVIENGAKPMTYARMWNRKTYRNTNTQG